MKKIFLINAHQRYEGYAEGRFNQSLIDIAEELLASTGHETRTTIVEAGYDISEELEKHKWADCIIVQTPVYWMSVPYIFKKYIDEVQTPGVGEILCRDDGRSRSDPSRKYGSGGLMQGKKYMISTTWNAPLEALEDPDQFFEGKGVDGVFMWLHKNYQFLGMKPLPTFSCYDILKCPDAESNFNRYREHLKKVFG